MGLVLVGQMITGTPDPANPEDIITYAAIRFGLEQLSTTVWHNLPFQAHTEEGRHQFYTDQDAEYGITFDTEIKPKLQPIPPTIEEAQAAIERGEQATSTRSPDMVLAVWVGEQLKIIIPRLTTEFWEHDKMADDARKVDAKLKFLREKKKSRYSE